MRWHLLVGQGCQHYLHSWVLMEHHFACLEMEELMSLGAGQDSSEKGHTVSWYCWGTLPGQKVGDTVRQLLQHNALRAVLLLLP